MTILSQNRLEVTCRHPTTGATNTHYFVMPDTGQEASVQSIYAVISANLSPVHFEPRFGNAALEDWCPTMFHTNNGQVSAALCASADASFCRSKFAWT
jgi:hypothetical protein